MRLIRPRIPSPVGYDRISPLFLFFAGTVAAGSGRTFFANFECGLAVSCRR